MLPRIDVLVENFQPDEFEKLGLDPIQLQAEFPELIVVSISTFGREGPHASYRGRGLQASAGSAVAQRTGDPARSPLAKPLNEPEYLGGLHAAAAMMVALLARDQVGRGQHIDIAIQDILASVTSGPVLSMLLYGGRGAAGRTGHRVMSFFPWTVLPVADGYVEFITMQERHWRAFIGYLGNPEWAEDPRFQDIFSRAQHAEEIEAHMVEALRTRTWAQRSAGRVRCADAGRGPRGNDYAARGRASAGLRPGLGRPAAGGRPRHRGHPDHLDGEGSGPDERR